MGPIEIAAAALIALAVVACIVTVIAAAADAGRVTAERLQLRAEMRSARAPAAPDRRRARDGHRRGGVRERPPRRRG
jgi:hypothetical protein